MKVLVVDDEEAVRVALQRALTMHGYEVVLAADGFEGRNAVVAHHPDMILLDLTMPNVDGLRMCRQLREAGDRTPVIVLTARTRIDDRVEGLDAGADDYLVKPFEVRELEARLRALIRRDRRQVSSEVLNVGDMTLDTATLRLTRGGQELTVSPIGLKLLAILMRESPRVVSRRDIEREIWGDTLPDSDTLRSHLYNLRRVIDKPFDRPLLHTIHSAGYRLADLDSEVAASQTA